MENLKFEQILEKIKKLKEGEQPLDLSSKEDLAIGIMNLISLEEHLIYTYNKTKEEKYLDLLNEIRVLRIELLKQIIKDYEGEVWCISKHLLSSSMRLMEVGTKKLKEGDTKTAKDLFEKSYSLWNLFWGLNLKIIENKDIKAEKDEDINLIDEGSNKSSKISVFEKLSSIIKKVLDCCRE
ncbi:MAG: hypothetical protein ACP5OX_00390 [Minisyncoccia bacterium]